jgi:SAM-dependent methyltransferase
MTSRSASPKPESDDWERHWNRYAESARRNPAQKYRRRLILGLLDLRHDSRVLDIGSGQGDFLCDLCKAFPGVQAVGVELSRTGVEIATHKVPHATFVQHDLLQSGDPEPQLRRWATHAVCSEVLEHLDHPQILLSNVRSWLAPGCRLVVTVPGGPKTAFDRFIGHRKHYTPGELRALLESAGFTVPFVCGAGFPFFNLYRLTVLLRGNRVARDVAQGQGSASALLVRMVMKSFDVLFYLNRNSGRFGWQSVAIAEAP